MNMHKHARLTPRGRALLVQRILEHGLRVAEAAQAAGVSVRTAYKWLSRFRAEGPSGLADRSSRPRRCPHATPAGVTGQILERRRQRQTYHQIARATVGRLLRRAGLNRLAELEPAPPVQRYEYASPGELLHLDIKRLGRFWRPGHRVTGSRLGTSDGAGWEYVHIAIDDHSRIAHAVIPVIWASVNLDFLIDLPRRCGNLHFQLVPSAGELTPKLKCLLRRRQVVKPMIGHMKTDGLLARNWLRGEMGDVIHAVLCGAGHNLRMILAYLRGTSCGPRQVAAGGYHRRARGCGVTHNGAELTCSGPTQ